MVVLNTDANSDNNFLPIKEVVLLLLNYWLVIITWSFCNVDSNMRNSLWDSSM